MPEQVLGIHVIGAGFGESIVVQLPDETLGIIDCCCSTLDVAEADRPAVNPTIGFVRKHFPNHRVCFIALTHPHEDHGRGFNQLLDEFGGQVHHVWCCDGLNEVGTQRYFALLAQAQERLDGEKLFEENPGTFAVELYNFAERVAAQLARDEIEFATFAAGRSFDLCNGQVGCSFLGPRENRTFLYSRRLAGAIRGAVDVVTGQIDPTWNPPGAQHNEVSPAIYIKWKKAVVILGGDMEHDAWRDVIADTAADGPPLKCAILKASHHGSSNGYCDQLYEAFGNRFIAIATPFSRHRRPLPELAGLRHLLDHSTPVLVTNRDLAIRQLVRRGELKALSPRTLHWLSQNQEVVPYLVPELVNAAAAAAPPAPIPPQVLQKLAAAPQILGAVRTELKRQPQKLPDMERAFENCRVSVYLNEHGHEIKRMRYVGRMAGEITAHDIGLEPRLS